MACLSALLFPIGPNFYFSYSMVFLCFSTILLVYYVTFRDYLYLIILPCRDLFSSKINHCFSLVAFKNLFLPAPAWKKLVLLRFLINAESIWLESFSIERIVPYDGMNSVGH